MFGTDQTIGVWSALTRIVDAIDCLESTGESHRRAFVVECMGRHCGFLSAAAALVTCAEYVLVAACASRHMRAIAMRLTRRDAQIPEAPPCSTRAADDATPWQTEMCDILRRCHAKARNTLVVVVCEGAIDRLGNKIAAEDVRATIEAQLGIESRLTVCVRSTRRACVADGRALLRSTRAAWATCSAAACRRPPIA